MANFNPAKDIPDLKGKTIVVTGGNAGLGASTVMAVAAHNPAKLFLCARTPSKAEAFIDEIRKQHPNTTTQPVQLDLASLDSVKAAAKQINESCDEIDVLFLNAGVAVIDGLTKDGYEIQFGTNHIGHALFTQLLMPKVLAASKKPSADARIVVLSSVGAHRFRVKEGIAFDRLKTDMVKDSGLNRYGQSKLANLFFAQSLAKEYPQVTSVSVHPGTVATEILGKADGSPYLKLLISSFVRWFGLTAEQGAVNQLYCGFGQGVQNGAYYEPVAKVVAKGSANAQNVEMRDKLWDWTNAELAAHGGPGWPSAK